MERKRPQYQTRTTDLCHCKICHLRTYAKRFPKQNVENVLRTLTLSEWLRAFLEMFCHFEARRGIRSVKFPTNSLPVSHKCFRPRAKLASGIGQPQQRFYSQNVLTIQERTPARGLWFLAPFRQGSGALLGAPPVVASPEPLPLDLRSEFFHSSLGR